MRTDSPLLHFYYSKLPKAQVGQQTGSPDKPYSKSNPQGYVSMKNNQDWFDSHANWSSTGNQKWDNYVRKQILTGRFGLDPNSGALIKLPKSEWTSVPDEYKTLAKDYRTWTDKEKIANPGSTMTRQSSQEVQRLAKKSPTFKKYVDAKKAEIQKSDDVKLKRDLTQSTYKLMTNPVMMAPGAILTGGMAAGIPAVSRTAAAVMPALETSIGNVPGLTAGNLINAGFAYKGAKNIPNVVKDWQNVKDWESGANALANTVITGLDMFPFINTATKGIPSVLQDINGLGKTIDRSIFPTRAYRVEAIGGNKPIYETSELANKVNSKGDWATSSLPDLFDYSTSRGLLEGKNAKLTEYKVPFWKKNVSFDPDVVALKQEQGIDLNKNEYIIPKNSFLYPRRSNIIEAVPENVKTQMVDLGGGQMYQPFSKSVIPLSYESEAYSSPAYKYLEDQINAVTGHRMPITFDTKYLFNEKFRSPIRSWIQPKIPTEKGIGSFNPVKNALAESMESGFLSKAHTLNPFALTEKKIVPQGTVARQIFGDEAYQNFLKYGPTTQPGVSETQQLVDFATAPKWQTQFGSGEIIDMASTMRGKDYTYPYFSEGKLWYDPKTAKSFTGKERIITTPSSEVFRPAGESSVMLGNPSKEAVDVYAGSRRVLMPGTQYSNPEMYKVYEPHWWQGYKPIEVPKSTPSFKSEIDWGNWNSEIPSNQALMQEYNTIEQTFKANGSWMKNPDGSPFQGTPEQFVQQQSSNFKKAFGNSKLLNPDGSPMIVYHGSAKKFDTFDPSKFQLGDAGYSGSGIYTTPSKTTANSYATSSAKLHKGDIEPTVYELYGQANNPISSEELIKEGKNRDLFNFYRDANSVQGKLSDFESLRNYDVAIHNQLPHIQRVRPWNDAWEIVFPKNTQVKSAIGNNGMFDMTNPNIYKALIPAIVGASALKQKRYGGDISIPALTTKMPALLLGGSTVMQPRQSPLLNYYLQRTGSKRMIR